MTELAQNAYHNPAQHAVDDDALSEDARVSVVNSAQHHCIDSPPPKSVKRWGIIIPLSHIPSWQALNQGEQPSLQQKNSCMRDACCFLASLLLYWLAADRSQRTLP